MYSIYFYKSMFINLLMLFIDFTGNIHNYDKEKPQEKYEEACYDR